MPAIVESLPAREWKLSEMGRERAKRLADQLYDYQSEIIISSVEPKAMETAEIVARKLGLAVYVIERLHEHDLSNTAFLAKDQFRKVMQEFFSRPTELVLGNETADQSYRRFSQAVHSVLNHHKERTIIIVAHGTVISLFVSRLMGLHDFSLWNELGLPSFIVIDRSTDELIKKENIT